VDWRNPWVRAIEAEDVIQRDGLDCRERKHQNLQSSVFGGGYVDNQEIKVDLNAPKITFGSNADWKTQAALAHPKNDCEGNGAYKLRQQELVSKQVNLEQTDFD
jgi:hypothetical protein